MVCGRACGVSVGLHTSAVKGETAVLELNQFWRNCVQAVHFDYIQKGENMSQNMSASGKLRSEQVVVSAPLSFAGSAKRIWKITDQENIAIKYALAIVALTLIVFAWMFVAMWYFVFGVLLVPYRMIRRGSRKDKRQALQHREQLEALTALQINQAIQTANLIEQNKNKP